MVLVLKRWMILALCALALPVLGCEREPYERPTGEGWILVDLYHTRIQNPVDHRLVKDTYAYQGAHGFARVFDHLEANGYPWGTVRELTLSKERLKGYKVLFINLMHDQRPDFTAEEREAITEFVREGGGLFLIADHSNVYRHAERANRLLKPMGVEIMYHTAMDYAPHAVSGIGWIAITNLSDHPTNDNVEMISFQTGGTVLTDDPAHATARLSEKGQTDLWDESNDFGFYGDWTYNGDPEAEPQGPTPVVAAATFGEGRVVVVGDQNIYGDTWVHFGDNFTHILNIFEWLAQRETDAPRLHTTRPAGVNIGVDIRLSALTPGQSGPDDYYTFFVNLNRDPEVTGRGIQRFDLKDDALILTAPSEELEGDDLEKVEQYLKDGKRVVLMFETPQIKQTSVKLLNKLAPGMVIKSPDAEVAFGAEVDPAEAVTSARQLGAMHRGMVKMNGPKLDLSEHEMASYTLRYEGEDAVREPYLLKLTSDWGEPLVQATAGGETWDVARVKKVHDGELIVFIQDGFWRVRVMGKSEAAGPPEVGKPAVTLQYHLMDYLKKPVR